MLQDIVCISISGALLLIYHTWFIYTLCNHPSDTVTGWTYQIRKQWVHETRDKSNGNLLVIQTIRNWLIVASFLATVSITIAFTVIQVTISLSAIPPNLTPYSIFDNKKDLLRVKALIIVSCNFISFFCFSQAVRYLNHVGFAMNVQMNHTDSSGFRETAEHVGTLLNLGSLFFTLGIRGYFFTIPFVFWLFGPYELLVSTVILIGAISFGDRNHGTV